MKLVGLALLGLAVLGPQANAANILINGNLDQTQPVEIVPGFFLPKPAGWINEGTRAITGAYEDEMSSEPWAGPAPTPVTADGSGLPVPNGCDGFDCAVFFKAFSGDTTTNGAATGHLYQDVAGIAGTNYRLTGWAGAEANLLVGGVVFALDFLNGSNDVLGSSILDLLAAGLMTPNGQAFNYKAFAVAGVAPLGTVMVRARVSMIDGLSNPAGGGQAFVVDDFSLEAVEEAPEPTTVLLVGLGLAAVAWKRQRKARISQ